MEINYLAEIIAFERWLETHYLPISSQLLWYKIMAICNKSGWSEWVTVDNLRLMAAMQMSREATLIKARDELIKAGRICYQKGKKGSPNRYKMVFFTFKSEVKGVVESEVKGVVESEVKGVVESADINKQKQKQKQKKRISNDIPEECATYYPDERLNQAVLDYISFRKEIKKPMSENSIRLMMKKLDGMASSDGERIAILEQSIVNGWQGIFPLKDRENRKPAGKPNQFHNFQQRETDYDALILQQLREEREEEDGETQ